MARKGERDWRRVGQSILFCMGVGDGAAVEGSGLIRGRTCGGDVWAGEDNGNAGDGGKEFCFASAGESRMKVMIGAAAMENSARVRRWLRAEAVRRICRRSQVMRAMSAPCQRKWARVRRRWKEKFGGSRC